MGLNIKNPETHRLVRRLAELTGESLTGAITEAVRERLERVEREQSREWRLKRMRDIAEETGRLLKDAPWDSTTFADELYDKETGLPK